MLLEFSELTPRVRHLLAVLFTEWTGIGLLAALAVWLAVSAPRGPRRREALLLVVSLAVLAWFVGLDLAAGWLAYALTFWAAVELARPRSLGIAAIALLLAAQVLLPVVAIGPLGERGGHAREFTAFASNMAFLRFHAYAWDRSRRGAARLPAVRFLLAMLFFPTFVNGPVETPRQMEDGWLGDESGSRRRAALGGLGRIVLGCAKLVLVGLLFAPGWTGALAGGGTVPPGRLWLWGAMLYAWFYLSFSAWSDVAIGLGAICGRRVQENFARPWAALDPADFWRRWHLSFGLWLRDYIYIPLGGNRRHRALNVVVTFLVSAAWHIWGSVKLLGIGYFGPHAWGGFVVWGLLNAVGVLAAAPFARALPATGPASTLARAGLTFLFASFSWIPFFLPPGVPLSTGLVMLRRMLWPL